MPTLVLNAGSSSLKAAVFADPESPRLATVVAERLGTPAAVLRLRGDAVAPAEVPIAGADAGVALERVLEALRGAGLLGGLAAVGHRVVHGGPRLRGPAVVTAGVLAELRGLVPLDPLHLEPEVAAIERVSELLPGVPQVACFDTAFHRDLPDEARTLPLPAEYRALGAERYGFHGLSVESALEALRALDPAAAAGRVVVAHLGGGCSVTAVLGGRSVDTSMGLTPLGGLVMGTRPGDLDPGVLLYLLERGVSAAELGGALARRSGLLGLSGTSADVRELLAAEAAGGDGARLALAVLVRSVAKFVAGAVTVLGGVDTLVFTGGVGENAGPVRERVLARLAHLGPFATRVLPADEERQVARHAARALAGP